MAIYRRHILLLIFELDLLLSYYNLSVSYRKLSEALYSAYNYIYIYTHTRMLYMCIYMYITHTHISIYMKILTSEF